MARKYMYFLNEEREKLSVLEKVVPALLIFFLLFITFVSNQIIAKQHSVVAVEQDCDYLWTIQENFLEEQRIKMQKELEAAQKKRYADLTNEDFDKMQHIYSHKDEKIVFLTFDDGPTSNITPQVLDILKAYNVKATFFVLGKQVVRNPDLIKREYNEGHSIESHTYSHSYKTVYASKESFFDEFNRTQTSLQDCLGVDGFRTLVVRMPGGTVGGPYHNIKKEISSELRSNGIASLDWNCLTKDAEGAETYDAIMNNVYTYTGNKTSVVLLMHDADTKQITADTLPKVIEYYRDNGYKFVTVEEYLGRT